MYIQYFWRNDLSGTGATGVPSGVTGGGACRLGLRARRSVSQSRRQGSGVAREAAAREARTRTRKTWGRRWGGREGAELSRARDRACDGAGGAARGVRGQE